NYYPYQVSNVWRQCFINNAYTRGKRFDFVNQRNLGGIGIWALGYDDGYPDYWNAISDHFTSCTVVPCSDTLWDMGGSGRNYYSNENYTTTIAPTGAASVSLNFLSFNTQLNVDSLWLYDGPSASAPLLGVYSGSNSPGTVNSTGPTLSLRFKSNASLTYSGWAAVWSCVIDAVAPTTTVVAPSGWQTTNFNATFTDVDNVGGTGIEKSFYQVADYNATEWRSNNTRGFFNDDFNQATIHPDWTPQVGIWSVNGNGKLEQSDETPGNTNIYAPLTQNLSNRYVYHWQGKISGTGNNRRAGFHFFCDNPTLTNRGNSYFVWFRLDQAVIEIYKVVNDVFTLQSSSPYTFVNNQWYDYKVSYDRISGVVEVYVNDVFSASWTDSQPYSNGTHISFRNGNSNWQVDDFRVYRSRFSNAQTVINIGNCVSCDVRYENPNPATPSAKIRSLTKDSAHLLSQLAEAVVNIDWTPPTSVVVLDGLALDIDTTYNNTILEANWTNATDPNSGWMNYEYAIGSNSGDSDVVAWTTYSASSVTVPGLYVPQWYYFSVRSTNNAGLVSPINTSDGQELVFFLGLTPNEASNAVVVFPNPFAQELQLTATLPVTLNLFDVHGKLVATEKFAATTTTWNLPEMPAGVYLLEIQTENGTEHRRLIRR
ncbi:MAG: T9SS type A sorting domain-containing protein, partial [Bacteroidia bacterium]